MTRILLSKTLTALTLLLAVTTISAQSSINVVTTAVPFLRISPDARAGGMGDVGIASSPDATAGFWNMGKVAFNQSKSSIGVTYTPWLKDIVTDVYLLNAAGYYKLDDDQAINVGLRYFSLGNIQFTDFSGGSLGGGRPREFGFDFGYSRKLSERLGLGVALRYINSNLSAGAGSVTASGINPGNAVAGDIGLYYDGKDEEGTGLTYGAALTNLGSKISYTNNADQRDFIPTNLGIGVMYNKSFDEQNKLSFGIDLNKLLVPTLNYNGDPQQVIDYRKQGVFGSWFKSFNDFPGQASAAIGAEYWYNDQFALRGGYFYEDKNRGNRRYFSAGLGLKYNIFGLNFSYLAQTGSGINRNPLANTLRFSIIFDLSSDARALDQ